MPRGLAEKVALITGGGSSYVNGATIVVDGGATIDRNVGLMRAGQ